MSAPRKSMTEQTRVRLLDLWRGDDGFGRPLGCVTTSFTFDAELFEEQCLARFLSIQSNPNETAKAYLIEREEKLSQCFACVLVDAAHAAPDRSLRWHMLPVTLPFGGVLHAKLTLLAWERRVRVLIGSANLTEPAYRRNQELIAALEFGEDENPAPELLAQCVAFLHRVRRLLRQHIVRQKQQPVRVDTVHRLLQRIQRESHHAAPAGQSLGPRSGDFL